MYREANNSPEARTGSLRRQAGNGLAGEGIDARNAVKSPSARGETRLSLSFAGVPVSNRKGRVRLVQARESNCTETL